MRAFGFVGVAAVLAVFAAGCDGIVVNGAGTTVPSATTIPPAATPPPPETTLAPEPPLVVPGNGLGEGDSGDPVGILERRLDALRYDVGPVDGVFDVQTGYAVTAFQKVHDLPRSGRASPDVAERLASAQPPPPIVAGGGATRVEVDLPHQVLYLYEGDALHRILSISTGSGEDYCSTNGCATAVTPPGSYKVEYQVEGWDSAPLGELYNPVYFDPARGLAIHGFEELPADPASHGCIRISMAAAEWFPSKAPTGTPVYISDGQTALQPV